MSAAAPAGADPRARLRLEGASAAAFTAALARCEAAGAAARIWAGDHTLWKPAPNEIANRLGWLRSPAAMRRELPRIRGFVQEVRREGLRQVLLLGMGGSSLAPELFTATFGAAAGCPRVDVLDSTDPAAVRAAAGRCPPESTLYVVSTKSGGTVETLSFFKYFHALAAASLGAPRAGAHFAVVTDPGSSLEEIASRIGARALFLNDPDVGGRFSALTLFGLVPAALAGVDLEGLLDRADAMSRRCGADVAGSANPGVLLGAFAGGMALAGRDKLTLVCSRPLAAFGAWVEQLIAESTGKEGRGILPVVGEAVLPGRRFGADRAFVFLLLDGDDSHDGALVAVAAAGHPLLELRLRDPLDLGGEFFRWEFATAVAGHLLGVNPFDQPDVESAKKEARAALAAYRDRGKLPAAGREVAGEQAATEIAGLLAAARPGDYVALQAFVDPAGAAALQGLAEALRERSGLAVTVGFGPRFLHSTGQLHKGGAPGGIFVQLVSANPDDLPIPDDFGSAAGSTGFGVLKCAQSLGDLQALQAAGRRVARVRLGSEGPGVAAAIGALARALRTGG